MTSLQIRTAPKTIYSLQQSSFCSRYTYCSGKGPPNHLFPAAVLPPFKIHNIINDNILLAWLRSSDSSLCYESWTEGEPPQRTNSSKGISPSNICILHEDYVLQGINSFKSTPHYRAPLPVFIPVFPSVSDELIILLSGISVIHSYFICAHKNYWQEHEMCPMQAGTFVGT